MKKREYVPRDDSSGTAIINGEKGNGDVLWSYKMVRADSGVVYRSLKHALCANGEGQRRSRNSALSVSRIVMITMPDGANSIASLL